MHVGTGKASAADTILEALARGREDQQFFSATFLNRTLHDGQLEYVENSEATLNCLATANRYGKTTVLLNIHVHGCTYKTGGEPFYLLPSGETDQKKYLNLKYHTIHTADLWETAALVWDETVKIRGESAFFDALIREAPKSPRPSIEFINGARWKFRTLGDDASGIDGNSFYIISIDEAGWITDLEEKTRNVIRVRVADVRGRIHYVGTFKPGISKDFYKACRRAAAHTGSSISFEHQDDELEESQEAQMASSIRKYLREFFTGKRIDPESELAENLARLGISPDEYLDAVAA